MENLQVYDVTILPIIVAIVAAIVKAGLPKKWAPAVSVVIGIAAGIFYIAPHDPKQGVMIGIALGLAAVGLHSGTKNVVESTKKE
jgi:hypothetical protein